MQRELLPCPGLQTLRPATEVRWVERQRHLIFRPSGFLRVCMCPLRATRSAPYVGFVRR
jgi:hypothetical protein